MDNFILIIIFIILVLSVVLLFILLQKNQAKWKEDKDVLEGKVEDAIKQLEEKKKEIEDQNKALKEKQAEDDKRNWSSEGMARFSDYLREDTDNLEKFCVRIITHLTKFIGANIGGLFIKNDDDGKNIFFELIGAVAYDKKKIFNKKANIGEGLIGACAFDQKTIYYTEIPQDYIKIASGLGETPPKSLLIVPCIFNEEVYGIIELASINEIEEYKIRFVEELGEKIASTISIVKNNERMSKLLEQSKEQANELITSEEELRQNLEEMRATQEQSDKREKELLQEVDKLKQDNNSLRQKIRLLEGK